MTAKQITIVEDPSLMDAVKRLDAELGELVDQLRAMTERMAADNQELAKRLNLAPRKQVQHG